MSLFYVVTLVGIVAIGYGLVVVILLTAPKDIGPTPGMYSNHWPVTHVSRVWGGISSKFYDMEADPLNVYLPVTDATSPDDPWDFV